MPGLIENTKLERARQTPIQDIKRGDCLGFSMRIGHDDIDAFARLTGDRSPIHMSTEAAQNRGFPDRVVHGLLVASCYSTVVGMLMPGANGVLLSTRMDYLEAVPPEADLRVSARVEQVSRAGRIVRLGIRIYHQGIVVVSGDLTARVGTVSHD